MAKRLQAMGQKNYRNGFEVTSHVHSLELPLKWKASRTIFVNSMSDLFHEDVDVSFIRSVFEVMNRASWHRFQVLTKRDERMLRLAPELQFTDNIWMGVSVENEKSKSRIASLRSVPAALRFLSLEPLLEPLGELDLDGIHWVIVGGESGPGARPMDEVWVREIKEQCDAADVPFFFKQWGGVNKKRNGRLLNGRVWDAVPEMATS
jgi:protein gp37